LANRTVQLYKYTKLPTAWRYCMAAFYPNNRIKRHAVLTPDGDRIIKDGYKHHCILAAVFGVARRLQCPCAPFCRERSFPCLVGVTSTL